MLYRYNIIIMIVAAIVEAMTYADAAAAPETKAFAAAAAEVCRT